MESIGTAPLDIGIGPDGRIAQVEASSGCGRADGPLDLQGCYVSPGWVDLHTHIFPGFGVLPIDPDLIGPATGVVMLVDAGTVGETCFPAFRRYVVDPCPYPIKVFLNIGSPGMAAGQHQASPFADWRNIDLLATRRCIEQNRDVIRGIKIMASKSLLQNAGSGPVLAAKRLATELQLPVMVHIGEPPIYLEELVEILGAGDVITHCFHGKVGNSLAAEPSRIVSLYRRAAERGIRLDVGHGSASFCYESARAAVQNGIKPYTISTDLHRRSYETHARSMSWVMSKMLACGLAASDIIAAVTAHPAEVLGEREWSFLRIGAKTALTVFEIRAQDSEFVDTGVVSAFTPGGRDPENQRTFHGDRIFKPRCVVWNGAVIPAEDRAVPAGS